MKDLIILRIVTKLIIPLILLFGLYVQFHGDYSPGGGFQAGVILASGFILYNIIFGINVGEELLSQRLSKNLMGLGVLLFVGVGIAGMVLGDNFLEYSKPLKSFELYPKLIIATLVFAPISKTRIMLKSIHLPLSFTLSMRVSALSALFKLITIYCLLITHPSSYTKPKSSSKLTRI